MRQLRRYQAGGPVGGECPESTMNPEMDSMNKTTATQDGDIAYNAAGGTENAACSKCALFDIASRMQQCMQESDNQQDTVRQINLIVKPQVYAINMKKAVLLLMTRCLMMYRQNIQMNQYHHLNNKCPLNNNKCPLKCLLQEWKHHRRVLQHHHQ